MSELQNLDEEGKKISKEELETDPERTSNPISKNLIEESEDNDGENRNVKEEERRSIFSTTKFFYCFIIIFIKFLRII